MPLMSIEEKRKKLKNLVEFFRLLGYEDFRALEEADAVSSLKLAPEEIGEGPAYYLPSRKVAVFRLEDMPEDECRTTIIDFCLAHEFVHYAVDLYVEKHGKELGQNLKSRLLDLRVPESEIPDLDFSSSIVGGDQRLLGETLINSLAYHFLAHLESLKVLAITQQSIEDSTPALYHILKAVSPSAYQHVYRDTMNDAAAALFEEVINPIREHICSITERFWASHSSRTSREENETQDPQSPIA